MNNRKTAEHIFLAGVRNVLPEKIVSDLVILNGSLLKIGTYNYDLERFRKVIVIGAGKASAAFGHYLENILGSRISGGFIVTKYGCYCRLRNIMVSEAGHPVPDDNSFRAAAEIVQLADGANEDDLVICIWSGGGSSLLSDYPQGSSPLEMKFFNDMLVRCGADINEINIIRKHLSGIKGGQLARHIWPATSMTIYLSDVIGDPPDVVASGPTVPDNSTFSDALTIAEKHNLIKDMPLPLLDFLEKGKQGMHPDTPKPGDMIFSRSSIILAGNISAALSASKREAEESGYSAYIITDALKGDTHDACAYIMNTLHEFRNNDLLSGPLCLLFGGETTVKVTGLGHGGRSQHLALLAATRLQDIRGVTLLVAGTDGNDGNTEMAGAIVDSETIHDALSMNVDPLKYLEEFDSYNFFRETGGHLYTGPTMTNVMDLVVALIE